LDPIQWSEIRELIRELGQKHGIILSTHILSEVQTICSHVQIMHRGRLVYASSLTDLTQGENDQLLIQLSLPPTAEHLAALPGIAHVDSLGAGRFRLRCAPYSDPVTELVTCAYERGWGLRELISESLSLEQIFIDLTLGRGEAAA
jgi:ABC-2 type transport system ATP-binding protein